MSEKEYIERGALMEEIRKHIETIGINAERLVARFAPADVEPVVRCKECVNSRELYGDGLESVYNEMWCEDAGRIVCANGFCECGERSGDI